MRVQSELGVRLHHAAVLRDGEIVPEVLHTGQPPAYGDQRAVTQVKHLRVLPETIKPAVKWVVSKAVPTNG